MATRRAHNKTRLGCQQCKKRRIKCDVKQPSCANCDKKGLDCSFLLLAPTSRLSVVSPAGPSGSIRSTPSHSPSLDKAASSRITSESPEFSFTHSPLSDASGSLETGSPDSYVLDSDSPSDLQVATLSSRKVPLTAFASPELELSPYLRFDDSWHDARASLPPPLREILVHYEYTTSLTLAANDQAKTAWQAYVPEMASQHPWLLNCVLSVAALHLGRLLDFAPEKARMNAMAASRMNKALTEYRSELQNMTPSNAAALFASVTLTAVYLFRTSSLDIENLRAAIPPRSPTTPPDIAVKILESVVRTIHGLRGPMAVLLNGWNWVVHGKMNPVAARKWWPKDRTPATSRAIEEDKRLRDIGKLWENSEDEDRKSHLNHALEILRDTFGLVSQLTLPARYPPMTAIPYSIDDTNVGVLTDRGTVFVWAARIRREYVQLLEAKDRDALVVFAHYAVLSGRVRNVWWMEGMGADIVMAVAMYFNDEDKKLIEWPAKVVGVDWSQGVCKRRDRMQDRYDDWMMQVI